MKRSALSALSLVCLLANVDRAQAAAIQYDNRADFEGDTGGTMIVTFDAPAAAFGADLVGINDDGERTRVTRGGVTYQLPVTAGGNGVGASRRAALIA